MLLFHPNGYFSQTVKYLKVIVSKGIFILIMAAEQDRLTTPVEQYLHRKYYDPAFPGSFSGLDRFFKAIKKDGVYNISRNDVQEWLSSQDTYTVNKPVRRKFKRNRVIVSGIDDQWDGDLMDLSSLAKYNKNYKFILLLIDIFSRFVWAVPLKSKHASEIIRAFKKVFSKGRKPSSLRTDNGGEFVAKSVKHFLKEQNINAFTTKNAEIKANYAERAIRTIKGKILKYTYSNQTYKYIDALDSILIAYNKSFHSSIKMAPQDVNETNESTLWKQLYLPQKSNKIKDSQSKVKRYKYLVGDTVRISFLKKTFSREYDQKWSDEIFRISKRFRREGLPVYKLHDFNGKEEIKGTFYQQELQKVKISPDKLYKIDKILGSKTVKGKRKYLVSWVGWGPEFNSYVSAHEIKHLKKTSKLK